jgi:threonine/homoserine/homoserine lactone efflux protein
LITFTLLGAWIVVATVATVSPGPDTALVMGHAARGGVRSGVAVAMGIATGNLWYAALFGFGLISLLSAQPAIYTTVKVIGAIYLGWIGFKMLLGAIWRQENAPNAVIVGQTSRTLRASFQQGLLTNVLNPKIALFFLAAIPQFVGESTNAALISVLLILINGVINLIWLTLVAIGVGRVGNRLATSQIWRLVEGAVGVALMGMAGRIAFMRN